MLNHLDDHRRPKMVDVSPKNLSRREAVARASVIFPHEVWAQLESESPNDIIGPKGPVAATAIVAGIQAVKRTWELIPMCHPLPIEGVSIVVTIPTPGVIFVTCSVQTTYKTGVEMEALTGASIAALTIYDMTKALSHAIEIRSVSLLSKTGGKSDMGSVHGQS